MERVLEASEWVPDTGESKRIPGLIENLQTDIKDLHGKGHSKSTFRAIFIHKTWVRPGPIFFCRLRPGEFFFFPGRAESGLLSSLRFARTEISIVVSAQYKN